MTTVVTITFVTVSIWINSVKIATILRQNVSIHHDTERNFSQDFRLKFCSVQIPIHPALVSVALMYVFIIFLWNSPTIWHSTIAIYFYETWTTNILGFYVNALSQHPVWYMSSALFGVVRGGPVMPVSAYWSTQRSQPFCHPLPTSCPLLIWEGWGSLATPSGILWLGPHLWLSLAFTSLIM